MASEYGLNAVPGSRAQFTPMVQQHAESLTSFPSTMASESPWGGADAMVSTERQIPPFAGQLDDLLVEIFSTAEVAREALGALNAQARALALVWEAHRRGAISLPDSIARTVCDARECWPSVLRPPVSLRAD